MPYDYDMLVIGGGAAGLTAAGMSAVLGAKTGLIEAHRLGGDCTWYGCIRSKTLLHAAKLASETRSAQEHGLFSGQLTIEFDRVMELVRRTRQQVYEFADAPSHFEELGMTVVQAPARFIDPHTIGVTDSSGMTRIISSRFFVIATGSRPRTPAFQAPVFTNESIFELNAKPDRLVILGKRSGRHRNGASVPTSRLRGNRRYIRFAHLA